MDKELKKADRQPTTDMQTIKLFWQASLRHRRLMLQTSLNTFGLVFLYAVSPYFIGKIIGSFFIPGTNHTHYLPYFLVSGAIGVVCNRIGFTSLLALQANVQAYLEARALNALLQRGVSFHSNNVSGKLVSDVIDFSGAYGALLITGFGNLAAFGVTFLVGSLLLFAHSWLLGLIVATMAVFTFGTSYIESRRRTNLRQQRLIARKAATSHIADTVSNVLTVKSFAQEAGEMAAHNRLGTALRDMRLRDWMRNTQQNNNRIIVMLLFQLAFVLGLLYLVPHNPAILGIGIFGFTFAITISNRMIDITIQLLNVEEALLQASPMTAILQQETEIQDKPDASALHVKKGAIAMDNLSFHYSDASHDDRVFHNLSLTIKPGEKIGLVGPSGGGKSTLTRLLLRFEDINDGSISIDGQNIAEVTQVSLRRQIAYVPQEPLLFHRTITENIAYGKANASSAEIKQAAHRAYADEFISELPQGYDTIVGERGVKLSGGQRQRIAIARAMLKDAPILLLDEATSALDSESESYIQKALWELMKDRTTLVIAHRLSTIQHLDRIIVLEGGAITEEGTHAELLKLKGTYAKLWRHQTGGFIDD
jgi:ATP-binding cassette subfamily B protein